MKISTELKELREWIEQPGNSSLKLAASLGYKSQTTIDKWLKNKRIPHHRIEQLMLIIRKDQSK